jgi:hypothetical protein
MLTAWMPAARTGRRAVAATAAAAVRHTGDRNAASIPLVMIAQVHATPAVVQTLKDNHEDREVMSVDAY